VLGDAVHMKNTHAPNSHFVLVMRFLVETASLFSRSGVLRFE
jgi:hypothetical protein